MRKRLESEVKLPEVHIPQDLAEKIRLLLLDPMTQKIRYGALKKLITALLSRWVSEQTSPHGGDTLLPFNRVGKAENVLSFFVEAATAPDKDRASLLLKANLLLQEYRLEFPDALSARTR